MDNAVARKVARKVVKVMGLMSVPTPKGALPADEKMAVELRLKSTERRVDALEKRTSPAQ